MFAGFAWASCKEYSHNGFNSYANLIIDKKTAKHLSDELSIEAIKPLKPQIKPLMY